jgi:hypothetical protein
MTQAYFISPFGSLIYVITSHIDTVIKDPEAFGCTDEEIKRIYDGFGEPIGLEGKARSFILKRLIQKGWIRIMKYNNHWVVSLNNINSHVNYCLCSWAEKLLKKDVSGKTEDKYAEVYIKAFESSTITTMDILSGGSV